MQNSLVRVFTRKGHLGTSPEPGKEHSTTVLQPEVNFGAA